MPASDTRLIYIGDPMCSWCWGFAPEIGRLAAHLGANHPTVPLEVVVGGLRPGPNAQPLDDRLSGFLRSEWAKINRVTGQPFSFDSLDREDWIYDTEVPAAAVALAREIGVDPLLEFMATIQHAFYAEAVDITRPKSYAPLWSYAEQTGVSADDFVAQLSQPASRALAYSDFRRAREIGVSGFPAVVLERASDPPDRTMIAYGFQPADRLIPLLDRFLSADHTVAGSPE